MNSRAAEGSNQHTGSRLKQPPRCAFLFPRNTLSFIDGTVEVGYNGCVAVSVDAERQRRVRQRLLDRYGRACSRCGFDDERALQLDHINGGGRVEQKAIGVYGIYRRALLAPDGEYQILCANCNWIKRAENKEARGVKGPRSRYRPRNTGARPLTLG